jgi:hypothetical protein
MNNNTTDLLIEETPTKPVKEETPTKLVKEDSELISVYSKYLDRISLHYNLVLRQFHIYFGVNVALFGVFGFVSKPIIEACLNKTSFFEIPVDLVVCIGLALAIIGILFAIFWSLVMRDARRWQLIFNKLLAEWEEQLLTNPRFGFYNRINEKYNPNKKYGTDLMDICRYLSWLFIIVWIAILVLMVYWLYAYY